MISRGGVQTMNVSSSRAMMRSTYSSQFSRPSYLFAAQQTPTQYGFRGATRRLGHPVILTRTDPNGETTREPHAATTAGGGSKDDSAVRKPLHPPKVRFHQVGSERKPCCSIEGHVMDISEGKQELGHCDFYEFACVSCSREGEGRRWFCVRCRESLCLACFPIVPSEPQKVTPVSPAHAG